MRHSGPTTAPRCRFSIKLAIVAIDLAVTDAAQVSIKLAAPGVAVAGRSDGRGIPKSPWTGPRVVVTEVDVDADQRSEPLYVQLGQPSPQRLSTQVDTNPAGGRPSLGLTASALRRAGSAR